MGSLYSCKCRLQTVCSLVCSEQDGQHNFSTDMLPPIFSSVNSTGGSFFFSFFNWHVACVMVIA